MDEIHKVVNCIGTLSFKKTYTINVLYYITKLSSSNRFTVTKVTLTRFHNKSCVRSKTRVVLVPREDLQYVLRAFQVITSVHFDLIVGVGIDIETASLDGCCRAQRCCP